MNGQNDWKSASHGGRLSEKVVSKLNYQTKGLKVRHGLADFQSFCPIILWLLEKFNFVFMTQLPAPRRSTRVPSFSTSVMMKNLFFCPSGVSRNSKKVKLLHSDPPIYLIEDFLNSREYHYFDQVCTEYENSFRESFTEDKQNGEVCWLLSCWQLFRLFQPREHQDLSISQRVKIRSHEMLNEKQLSLLVLPPVYILNWSEFVNRTEFHYSRASSGHLFDFTIDLF